MYTNLNRNTEGIKGSWNQIYLRLKLIIPKYVWMIIRKSFEENVLLPPKTPIDFWGEATGKTSVSCLLRSPVRDESVETSSVCVSDLLHQTQRETWNLLAAICFRFELPKYMETAATESCGNFCSNLVNYYYAGKEKRRSLDWEARESSYFRVLTEI